MAGHSKRAVRRRRRERHNRWYRTEYLALKVAARMAGMPQETWERYAVLPLVQKYNARCQVGRAIDWALRSPMQFSDWFYFRPDWWKSHINYELDPRKEK